MKWLSMPWLSMPWLPMPWLLLLAGCAAAPATRLYTLAPTAPPAAVSPAGSATPTAPGGLVLVREVMLPRYLDRPQLVTRPDPYRLQLHELAHWGGDLGEDLTRVLADNLARRLPGRAVLPAPTFPAVKPAQTLALEILQFEAVADQLVLAARWQQDAGLPRELRLSRPLAHADTAAADAALVAAMSSLYGELADAIAAGLREAAR